MDVYRAKEKLRPFERRHRELLEIQRRNPSEELIQAITSTEASLEELQTTLDNAQSVHDSTKINKTLAENEFDRIENSVYAPDIVRFDSELPPQQLELKNELKLAEENADQQFYDFFICYEEVNQLPKKDCSREERRMVRSRNKLDKAFAKYEASYERFDDLNTNGPANITEAIRLPVSGPLTAMQLHFADRESERAFDSFKEHERDFMECSLETQQQLRESLDETFLTNSL